MNESDRFAALEALDALKALLPTYCPAWCEGGVANHHQAIDEGCSLGEASRHAAGDLIGSATVEGEAAGWNLWLFAEHRGQHYGQPYLELEAHHHGETDNYRWRMTTGAARVLARQLVHFADLADL